MPLSSAATLALNDVTHAADQAQRAISLARLGLPYPNDAYCVRKLGESPAITEAYRRYDTAVDVFNAATTAQLRLSAALVNPDLVEESARREGNLSYHLIRTNRIFELRKKRDDLLLTAQAATPDVCGND